MRNMRDAFVKTLSDIARTDPRVMLITGDLGFGVLTKFAEELPAQFLNAGVAEQDMMGMATGMALEGRIVFTYSIANFPTLRCLEQIRNDACYHDANVKIVAVGGGFSYGALGISHHATEDLAIMRALPNIHVFAPGDPVETGGATRAAYRTPGTCYLRLGRGGEPVVHNHPLEFVVGRAVGVGAGRDIIVISTGAILPNARDAVRKLAEDGWDVGLYSMPTIKPIDTETLLAVARQARLIVTIEEHSVVGGLGGAVAEVIAQMPGHRPMLKIIGLQDGFSCAVGDQSYLRDVYGLSFDKIINKMLFIIDNNLTK
jgi:transketolase